MNNGHNDKIIILHTTTLAARRTLRVLQTTPEGTSPGLSCATRNAKKYHISVQKYGSFRISCIMACGLTGDAPYGLSSRAKQSFDRRTAINGANFKEFQIANSQSSHSQK